MVKGISYFTKLQTLEVGHNSLTSLDLRKNTALTYLSCDSNKLRSLNLTKNTKLQVLVCSDNEISSLSLKNNKALLSLFCTDNDLTSVNVTECSNLEEFECWNNYMKQLDVSHNTKLKTLNCRKNKLKTLYVPKNVSSSRLKSYKRDSGVKVVKGSPVTISNGDKVTASGAIYKVTSVSKKTVALAGIKNKKAKRLTVKAKVKVKGKTFTVTSIAGKALNGCKKLKSVVIQSNNITSIGKNAIKGIYKKAVIKVPRKKLKAYRKLFTAATGFKKTMTIKGK